MKTVFALLSFVLFRSCASSEGHNYTASTPASPVVRSFLRIPLTDSIDFIRWKLSINDNRYTLECNYGIGKPNTNGFYDGGKKVSFNGSVKKDNNVYVLQNGQHNLKLAELNKNLLHILNEDNTLLVGNGGWSNAINSLTPSSDDQLMLSAKETMIKDSVAFEGRTPCGVPNVPKSEQCYKLKWYIVLYGKPGSNEPHTYRLVGTGYRAEGGRRGNFKINTGKDGRVIYELLDNNGNPMIHLVKLDEGVVIFTDEKGNLLVGDHDFSYTLNRRF